MYDKSFQRRGYPRGLRHACRAALASVAAVVLALPVAAQEFDNGLSIDSVDPQADAEAIAIMRAKMDSIHVREHRPTVGLVLSGGGAKGAAHVGVIRYLEELKIPVDMICGTSMGGLVGGIASLGYNSHYMDSLLRVQDWSVMLTDHIDPKYFSYSKKMYRETYLLSVPFMYSKKDFQNRIDEQFRFFDEGSQARVGENNLINSLPSGYAYGFNVNNLFSSIAVGYEDNISFADLPIPFFCVAADLVSLKAKNWSSGSVKEAMRSTMSIPGLFKPVRSQGLILVDGGTRNNFPVDLAKAMGCDIVIGVDLSDIRPSYSQVNNLGNIMLQFVSMLGHTTFIRNVEETDVFIKPQLEGFNMLSFSAAAIDTLISRGYQAAKARTEDLLEVKQLVGDARISYQGPRAVDINATPVRAYVVEFRGVTNAESRILQRKIRFKAGSYMSKDKLDKMMSIIQATGCFSSVTYSILGDGEPYRLVFECEKGPRNQLGAGIRFDTEEWASFIFNLGLNAHKLSGFKFDLDAKVGRNQMLGIRGALDVSWLPTLNLDARIDNVSTSLYDELYATPLDLRWWGHRERVYLSNIKWTSVDFNIGAQHRFYRLSARSTYGYDLALRQPELLQGSYVGLFANGTLYTQDRSYYPSRGVKMTFGYDLDAMKLDCDGFEPLHAPYLNFNCVLPLGRHLAIIPDIHARALMGSPADPDIVQEANPNYSLVHQNYIGGMIGGRNIDWQMPFIGFGNVYKSGPYTAVANLALRIRFAKSVYFSAIGGAFREADTLEDFISSPMPTLWGGGAELGFVTPVGPLKIVGTWCDRMHDLRQDLGLYISFGYDF